MKIEHSCHLEPSEGLKVLLNERGLGEFFFEESKGNFRASLFVQMVKSLPAMWETWVQSPGKIPWRR